MTTVWGPLGWMTLHSVASCYPESPSQAERNLMSSWLDMFRDTITCPHCRDHFTSMLAIYRAMFPNMLQSRQEFCLFTFRAHNAVNRRLNKPMYATVEECLTTLQTNVKTRSAKEYRAAYFRHILQSWSTYRDATGFSALKKILELRKIDADYIQPRDTNFDILLASDVVVLPRNVLERGATGLEEARPTQGLAGTLQSVTNPRVGIRFTSQGLRLRR
jgi:hypothetical protein